jgi:SAM-dependent methyltransferase
LDRAARLLGAAHQSQRILELGAGYSPIAPKAAGWRTHVVDHAPQTVLRAKYADAGVDIGSIEAVDTVWHAGRLHDAVPDGLIGAIDLIIASHVLEHLPDLIGFLQSASRLVRDGGALSIALPDRRYCFDCFRPWTTTGRLLEAHRQGLDRHSLATAFDQMAYSATASGQIAWGPRAIDELALLDDFAAAVDVVKSFDAPGPKQYRDCHAWQFTSASFQLVMLELFVLGVSDWRVTHVHGPENFEFFAVLHRSASQDGDGATLQARRQALLLAQLAETREQIDFILGKAGKADQRSDD